MPDPIVGPINPYPPGGASGSWRDPIVGPINPYPPIVGPINPYPPEEQTNWAPWVVAAFVAWLLLRRSS